MHKNALLKFPNFAPLRLNYALFLHEKMVDKRGAMKELKAAEATKPSFDE